MATSVKRTDPAAGTDFKVVLVGGAHYQPVLLYGSDGATPLLVDAAALSDTLSRNPVTTRVGAHLLVDDGAANAVRARGDTANGLDVDVTRAPADPFGANADAAVAAGAAGSIQAKLRRATQGLEDLKTGIVLAAGTNAVGKLAANSGVDIGDVDVTSVVPGTGATALGKAIDAAVGGTDTGVAALARRKDSLGTVTPADGDYVTLHTNPNGSLWAALEQFAAASALGDAEANPTTTRVGAMIMGYTGGTWYRLQVYGGGNDGIGANTGLIAHNYPLVFNGATYDRQRVPNVYKIIAATAITAGTGATVWTPAGGKKFRLMGWNISMSAAASPIWGDNAIGTVIARGAKTGVDVLNREDLRHGILSAAANNVLKLDVSANATVSGMVWGTEE